MYQHFMKCLYLNGMFYTYFMILDITFTFYRMTIYQRHYLLFKLFSPSHWHHDACVTISIYICSFYLFYLIDLCDFHVLYDAWVSSDIFVSTRWLLLLYLNLHSCVMCVWMVVDLTILTPQFIGETIFVELYTISIPNIATGQCVPLWFWRPSLTVEYKNIFHQIISLETMCEFQRIYAFKILRLYECCFTAIMFKSCVVHKPM